MINDALTPTAIIIIFIIIFIIYTEEGDDSFEMFIKARLSSCLPSLSLTGTQAGAAGS